MKFNLLKRTNMYENMSRGSEWAKWDLHVHTPFSIEQHYGDSQSADVWERFIKDIESLPPEVKALGINDYLFIDGYEKLLSEKQNNGRLKNIDLLLPVVEFRISKFAGVDFGGLARINLHVIFSNDLPPSVIRSQFLNALQQGYKLEPSVDGVSWSGVITKESIMDLGAAIKATVPVSQLSKYGTDLEEGFRNINLDENLIIRLLSENSYLKDSYLVALGKTEWDQLKWTDSSISSKKDIINKADFVFTAAESIEKYNAAKAKLSSQGVNDLLLDCSDAHYFSTTQDKDRIGNFNTWIKADLTFNGLKQVLNEPVDRVFVGLVPDSVRRTQKNPTKVIDNISVIPFGNKIDEKWFNFNIPLNSGLVAIIGNKGSGKSALADIIGLLGNTKLFRKFSFLTGDKFCSPKRGKSKHFQGTIAWKDGKHRELATLDSVHDQNLQERVKYIPQSYLEDICSEVGFSEDGAFYTELKEVIFSRINDSDRLGFDNLDSLLRHRDKDVSTRIDQLINDVKAINREIVEVEEKLSDGYLVDLNALLDAKKMELIAHESDSVKPAAVSKPDDEIDEKAKEDQLSLENKKNELADVETSIQDEQAKDAELAKTEASVQKVKKQIENLKHYIQESLESLSVEFSEIEIDKESIIKIEIDETILQDKLLSLSKLRKEIAERLNREIIGSLSERKYNLDQEILLLSNKLSEQQRKYHAYLEELNAWTAKKEELVGNSKLVGSKTYIEAQISEIINVLPKERVKLVKRRFRKTLEIYREKLFLRAHYSKYYGSVQQYLDSYPIDVVRNLRIKFDVSISERGFSEHFFEKINQARSGAFYGSSDGYEKLSSLLSLSNFDSIYDAGRFLRILMNELNYHDGRRNSIQSQLKKSVSAEDLYNLVFSLEYINPVYKLKWDGKELKQLSPGERGNLLLIFYLVLDQNDIPIIIDQPEENLDNQTVFNTLVPCVKDAKKRRQIIMVTHNPNLAVVCDADQVIHAKMVKDDGTNEVIYTSGAIESPEMNSKIIDVLEGTRPAFDKRDAKYWHLKQQ